MMRISTKLAIRKHKKHCTKVFRLKTHVAPYGVTYKCESENKVIATEKRVNKALLALQKARYAR